MRAITCKYDPSAQVTSRLTALENIGHSTNKINIRIIGGTWSHYPKQYQTWFIKECFNACNIYAKKSGGNHHTLYELQEINQSANQKIVEISIETRQDFITKNEILHLRKLGVTKVELGVQSLYEKVLRFNKRGHSLKATKKATALLKQAGFKISYQMMLNLPQSDSRKDVAMFGKLFSDPAYKPDFLKIYPLALVKEAPVYKLYLDKKFKPYNEKKLIEIIKKIKKLVPYYCRIERIIRDIPSQYIVEGGSKISNLRQTICAELENENTPCRCIRCREIRNQKQDKNIKMFRQDYDSSGGKEIFLSYESKDRQRLYSILRLRFDQKPIFPFLTNAAMIREIHTYGEQIPLGETSQHAIQHKGLGKELLKEAEKIARHEFETKKIAVIAGVGVRNYFVKQGYRLNNTYMVKRLTR